MRVAAIHRYPVKGLDAEPLESVALAAGNGLAQDRRFAMVRGDTSFDPAAPRWVEVIVPGTLAVGDLVEPRDAAAPSWLGRWGRVARFWMRSVAVFFRGRA